MSAARWVQYTYGSIPVAGWSGHLSSGEPTADELALIGAHLATQFEGTAFPDLGHPRSVYEALPRRFAHLPLADGRALLIHTTMLDSDDRGRPGNTYSHAVLDRAAAALGGFGRAAELWRSPSLLAPHLWVELERLQLSEPPLRAGTAADRGAVLDFLFAPGQWRIGVLAVLADAVAEAMTGGRGVVLRSSFQDTAALWLSALSQLMTAVAASRFGFSLHERGDSAAERSVHTAFAQGAHVAVIEAGDDVSDGDVVLIDLDGDIAPGESGGSHSFSGRGTLVVGDPSQVLLQSVYSREVAEAVFAGIDDVAARTMHAPTAHPFWALAMWATLQREQFAEAAERAEAIVVHASPRQIARDEELRRAAEGVLAARTPGGPEQLWTQLQQVAPGTFAAEQYASLYLTAAIRDGAWLGTAVVRPVPSGAVLGNIDSYLLAATQRVQEARDRPATGPHAAASRARLLDFIVRSFPAEIPADLNGALHDLAAVIVAALVEQPDPQERAREIGEIAPRTRAEFLLPAARRRDWPPAPGRVRVPLIDALVPLFGPGWSPAGVQPMTSPFDQAMLTSAVLDGYRGHEAGALIGQWLRQYGAWAALPEDALAAVVDIGSGWDLTAAHQMAAAGGELPLALVEALARTCPASELSRVQPLIQQRSDALDRFVIARGYAAAMLTDGPLPLAEDVLPRATRSLARAVDEPAEPAQRAEFREALLRSAALVAILGSVHPDFDETAVAEPIRVANRELAAADVTRVAPAVARALPAPRRTDVVALAVGVAVFPEYTWAPPTCLALLGRVGDDEGALTLLEQTARELVPIVAMETVADSVARRARATDDQDVDSRVKHWMREARGGPAVLDKLSRMWRKER